MAHANRGFIANGAIVARNVVMSTLLHRAYSQSDSDEEVVERVVRRRPFVLSSEYIAASFNVAATWESAMVVAEDFFAVRLPKFFAFWVVIAFGAALVYVIPRIFDEILRRFGSPRHYRQAFRWLLILSLSIGTLWFALALVGIDFIGIVFSLGAAAIFFSSGLAPTISNMSSGIDEQINGRMDIGSEVTIAGLHGYVVEMSLQSFTLRDFDNPQEEIYVPNHYLGQYPLRITRGRPPPASVDGNAALEAYVVTKPKEN